MVLAIAAEMDWEVRQQDVKTAFMYADIEEDVFVVEPPGFEAQGKNGVPFVMKLGKSLYGLAQSRGNWFHTIDPVHISIGICSAEVRHLHLHLRPRWNHHHPYTICGRSPYDWRRYPIDREDKEEADGPVQDD